MGQRYTSNNASMKIVQIIILLGMCTTTKDIKIVAAAKYEADFHEFELG